MNELRDGGDQYIVQILQIPPHLRKSAMTLFEPIYEPYSHRNMIHHITIYSCTYFPEQSPGLGIPFLLDKSLAIRRACETNMYTQQAEGLIHKFPLANGKQYRILFDTEFVTIEFHYKYPTDDAAIMRWSDEDNLTKKKEIN